MWSFTKWCGRVTLWVCLAPLGLWRSISHGKNKRQRELQAQLARQHAELLAAQGTTYQGPRPYVAPTTYQGYQQ